MRRHLPVSMLVQAVSTTVCPPMEEAPPSPQDLLRKKRNGEELTPEEMKWFCEQVTAEDGQVTEAQLGAMMMVIANKGMSPEETVEFTRAMVESGDKLEWDESYTVVDKHSTGGVGDKVSIVLAPALAALGFHVPMLSGRGLGHTGGTLDKLESIPCFRVQNTVEQLTEALATAGCFIAGATDNLAPADKKMYGIRDNTATVDSVPLIVGSIISKKVAGGTQLLVVDVKVGKGALMKTLEEGEELGNALVSVGEEMGLQTKVILTQMDDPIGKTIGNALEIEECVNCMKGQGPLDLEELVAVSGGLIMLMKDKCGNLEEGKNKVIEVLKNGKALEAFSKMLQCQGVSKDNAEALSCGDLGKVLPAVPPEQITKLTIQGSGFIQSINALDVGEAVCKLGAGRHMPGAEIDYRVGVRLLKHVGAKVSEGDEWVEVHHATPELDPEIQKMIESSVEVGETAFCVPSRVLKML